MAKFTVAVPVVLPLRVTVKTACLVPLAPSLSLTSLTLTVDGAADSAAAVAGGSAAVERPGLATACCP